MRCRLAVLVPVLLGLQVWQAPAAPAAGAGQTGVGAQRHIDCRCRANGRTYELGATVCLPTPAGHRVAECRMVQNVTSWRFAQEDCSVTARLLRPDAVMAVPR
jgi:hypothetical protein